MQELSRQKWGDTETLEQTRDEIVRKRVLKRQSRRVDKRQSAEKQEQKLKRVKAKVEKNHGKAHVHVFQGKTERKTGTEREYTRLKTCMLIINTDFVLTKMLL